MAVPFVIDAQQNAERLPFKEAMLGKGLNQPFCDCNSGVRKLMMSVHEEQALPLISPEIPFVQTGYEQQYSDRSSAIVRADANYEVLAKINKFASEPQQHYYLILRDMETNKLKMQERIEYMCSNEAYGYAYDNTLLDQLDIGYEVPKGELLRKPTALDTNMNPRPTVNLLATYHTTDKTMEDSLVISKTAQRKLSSVLYKRVVVYVNDNDILLNLMGDSHTYKSFPTIGEEVKDGILCAVRRERIEDSLYTQSVSMLKTIMMSDDKYTPGNGTVIDINVRCNNPELLENRYTNSQLLQCYNDHIRFITEFVQTIDNLMDKYNMSHEDLDYFLEKMHYRFKQELDGVQFLGQNQNVYSGTEIEFIIKEVNVPSIGVTKQQSQHTK